VLKKAEGDWAATWLVRHRAKTHNRTLRERRRKIKHPAHWAAMMASRKVRRLKKLHEELAGGDLAGVWRAVRSERASDLAFERMLEA
jgi:hypothetical protein